ncbi:hypothetical protein Trydic_g13925 [Trypoxylus dichotomus]
MKYFNYNLFHTISRGFIAQTGDPTGSRNGGESIFGVLEGPLKRYFEAERTPRIKHTTMGLVSFVGTDSHMIGSQFFITLGSDLTYLDEQHCVFGEVMEGLDVLELLNEVICDQDNRPYQDVRITHTVVLDDPFPDPEYFRTPSRSPSPNAERLQGGRIAPDEEIDETQGKDIEEVNEIVATKEAKARATILEMIGDIPDADMAPPENVLFVCKLNPVTTDDDLEIIFSRFGKINSCEVIRDKKTGESLQYAFVEFDDNKACEDAYFKMDNVLIDDRRIHVDFSQSVAKVKWHGKGRGVTTYDDKGKRSSDNRNDIGNGRYKRTSDRGRNEYARSSERKDDYRESKSDERRRDNRERKTEYRRESNFRNPSYNRHDGRNRSSDQRRDSRRISPNRYNEYRSRIKQSQRLSERENDKRHCYKSRSRSHDKYKDNRRKDNSRDHRNRYDDKNVSSNKKTKSSSSNSKYSKEKKKQYKSSDEDSSTGDESESSSDSESSEDTRSKKKHKTKHESSPKVGGRSKQVKKKSKTRKKKHNSSSEED